MQDLAVPQAHGALAEWRREQEQTRPQLYLAGCSDSVSRKRLARRKARRSLTQRFAVRGLLGARPRPEWATPLAVEPGQCGF